MNYNQIIECIYDHLKILEVQGLDNWIIFFDKLALHSLFQGIIIRVAFFSV